MKVEKETSITINLSEREAKHLSAILAYLEYSSLAAEDLSPDCWDFFRTLYRKLAQ